MRETIDVLIVEDNLDGTALIFQALQTLGYEPVFERVETAEEMNAALTKKNWGLVLADHRLSDFGTDTPLSLLQKSGRKIPFIIVYRADLEEEVQSL